jgi:hypothetical protein
MKCENCGRPMKWEAYTLTRRPDDLAPITKNARLAYAWHCRCGMWDYASGRNAAAAAQGHFLR